MWTKKFLDRNPQFHQKKKQKPLAVKRNNAHNEKNFQEYFKKDKDICIEKQILDKNVWNIDETGYCAGCDKANLVINLDSDKLILSIDSDNWEYITLVKSISSGGKKIIPILILYGIRILKK